MSFPSALDASTDLAPPPAAGYLITFCALSTLRASEQVLDQRVQALAWRIQREGRWLAPLPIDEESGVVMDGNHRLQAAHRLGLRRLPCIALSYADPRVAVTCWTTGLPFDPRQVFATLARGALLRPKSTRHRFDPPLPATRFELELLR
jgi:hypothetical protein